MKLSPQIKMKTMMFAALLALSGGSFLAAPQVQAGPLSDLLLGEKAPESGHPGLWRHERVTPAPKPRAGQGPEIEPPAPLPPLDELLRLSAETDAEGRARFLLSREPAEGRPGVEIAEFPARSAGPMALYFLESVVRSMAETSGGSPFYIRNRLREAFVAAELGEAAAAAAPEGEVQAHRVEIRPFEKDPNRPRMGEFADLLLVFTITPEGRLLSLSADTPSEEGGYHERLTLTPEAP